MENLKWYPFVYEGSETNVEITEFGNIRRIEKSWHGKGKGSKRIFYGEVNTNNKKLQTSGYCSIGIAIKTIGSKYLLVHQIMAIHFLNYKLGNRQLVIDHIDSNKTNNSIKNLRIVTARENSSKEVSIRSGLPTGVRFHNKWFESNIRINGKAKYIGKFYTKEEASDAYQKELSILKIT